MKYYYNIFVVVDYYELILDFKTPKFSEIHFKTSKSHLNYIFILRH